MDKDWDPVPGIRNPRRGIQNQRLSWICIHPTHGVKNGIINIGQNWPVLTSVLPGQVSQQAPGFRTGLTQDSVGQVGL